MRSTAETLAPQEILVPVDVSSVVRFGRAGRAEKDKPGQMRAWQRDAYKQLVGKKWVAITAPTGSGKSLLQRALAAHWMRKGYRVIIAVPQTQLMANFAGELKTHDAAGKAILWPGCEEVTGADALADAGKASVTTHASLVAAYRKHGMWKKTVLVCDEAHHSSSDEDEQNGIGSVVDAFMSAGLPVILGTATWLRADQQAIVSEGWREQLVGYELPVDEHMRAIGVQAEVRYLAGELEDSLKLLFGEKGQKTIVWLPNENSKLAAMHGGKVRLLPRVLKAAGKSTCDLVTVDGRDERKDKLAAQVAQHKTPNTIVALNLGKEGFDAPELTRGVLMGPRASLPETIQCLGRLLRKYDGKHNVQFNILLPPRVDDTTAAERHLNEIICALAINWFCAPRANLGKAAKQLNDQNKMQKFAKDLTDKTARGAEIAELMSETFGDDADEATLGIARTFLSSADSEMREAFERAPKVKLAEKIIRAGVTAYSGQIWSDGLRKLREHFAQAPREYTEKEKAKSLGLVRGGMNCAEVSEALGYPRGTILRWANEAGLDVAKGERDETRKKAVTLVRAGASCVEAAAPFGVTSAAVRKWCRAAGVPTPRWSGHRPATADDIKAKAVALVRSGATCAGAAAQIGVSPTVVVRWCRAAGVEPQSRGAHRKADPAVRDRAISLVRGGKNYKEASLVVRVADRTVARWCKEAGL